MSQQKQPNPQYMVSSLASHVAHLTTEIAARDALLKEKDEELIKLKEKFEKQLENNDQKPKK